MSGYCEFQRPAMGSLFRFRLVGDDLQHLGAVADAAFDEIDRVERLLSWRDVRSETSRINREAAARPVLVDVEMCAVLQACLLGTERTDGYFSVVRPCLRREGPPSEVLPALVPANGGLYLDAERRLVRLTSSTDRIDFGGFGKGYALDQAVVVLRGYGVTAGLIDAGGSSVVGFGDDLGSAWVVGLRNPFPPLPDHRESWSPEVFRLSLVDQALSCSATFDERASPAASDLVDPHTGLPVDEPSACAVVCPSAAAAEILSTALVCMGRSRAAAYTRRGGNELLEAASSIFWIADRQGLPHVESLPTRGAE